MTKEGMAVVAATYPGWSDLSEKVVGRVAADPSRLGELAASGGSLGIAGYLSSLAHAEKASISTREMKLAARSASGSGGRPPKQDDFELRWQEIENADSGRLGL